MDSLIIEKANKIALSNDGVLVEFAFSSTEESWKLFKQFSDLFNYKGTFDKRDFTIIYPNRSRVMITSFDYEETIGMGAMRDYLFVSSDFSIKTRFNMSVRTKFQPINIF